MKKQFLVSKLSFFLILCISLFGCINSEKSKIIADHIAIDAGFKKKLVKGADFLFTTYQKPITKGEPFIFYIEGDGNVGSKYILSKDPTPKHPMLLKLAFMDKRPNVVYIARPCQYTNFTLNPKCNYSYWSNKRWSEDSVIAMNDAIKEISQGKNIELIGFSGGGAMAILIAARTPQVKKIITLAGNLDVKAFNDHHRLPLSASIGSLNPMDFVQKVKNIPQVHFIGENDTRMPAFITDKFVTAVNAASPQHCARYEILPHVTHTKKWEKFWDYIMRAPVVCEK